MAAAPQTTIRDMDVFGPRAGNGNWEDLRTFVNSIDPSRFRIPSTARSQLHSDGNFRLDMQGRFAHNGREFYNLQVQQGRNTVFAVYVEVSGYTSGALGDGQVVYRIQQSAYHKTEHTTMFVNAQGNAAFTQRRPQEVF